MRYRQLVKLVHKTGSDSTEYFERKSGDQVAL